MRATWKPSVVVVVQIYLIKSWIIIDLSSETTPCTKVPFYFLDYLLLICPLVTHVLIMSIIRFVEMWWPKLWAKIAETGPY